MLPTKGQKPNAGVAASFWRPLIRGPWPPKSLLSLDVAPIMTRPQPPKISRTGQGETAVIAVG